MLPEIRPTLLTRTVDWLIRWRVALLVLAVVMTAVAWPISRRLKFDYSIEAMYAKKDPHLQDFQASRAAFGGDEFLIVAYEEPNLFEPDSNALTEAAARRIEKFAEKLNQIPGLNADSTQHLAKALKFPYGRARIREITEGTLQGDRSRVTAIVLRVLPGAKSPVSRDETIARVRQVAAEHDPPAMVVGEPAQMNDMFRYVQEDGRNLFWVSLALLAFVLLVLLQKLRWVILPVVVVIASIIWTEAFLVLSGLQLSMVSSILNSLMTIIGVQSTMHISLTFRQQHRSLPPIEALRKTLIEVASPIWWLVVTTSFGFGVLYCSHINPVASFGIMMAIGSMVMLAAVLMFLPGIVLYGELGSEPPPTASDRRVAAVLGQITRTVEQHPRKVLGGSLALVAVASVGFLWLRVETDFSKNFRENSPIVQALKYVEKRLGGAGSWEVNFSAPETLTDEYIDKVRDFAERLRGEFGVSLEEIAATDDSGKELMHHKGRLSKVIAITDGLDQIKLPFVSMTSETRLNILKGLQAEFVNSLYNPSTKRMRILLRGYERQPAETKLQLITEVERLAQETFPDTNAEAVGDEPKQSPDLRAKSTGLYVLLSFLIDSLLDDQWTSSWMATVGMTAMVWYAFRSLPIGLMSLLPNLFPNVLVIGMMGWVGLPINIATAMIACVSMGLTVDTSIIYLDGYQRARARGMRVNEALQETHSDIGRSLVYSNFALMAGFSVLSLSHFIPLVYFGLLISLSMLGGLIGNLVFLPLLLGWWDGRKEAREDRSSIG